jgi:hypothetical protein
MASIRKELSVQAAPESVWAAVRDFGAVHRRLVPGVVVDTRLEGDTRVVTFANGAVIRERIVDVDDEARRLAYTVVDGPLPVTHHNASMQVVAETGGGSRIVWVTDVLPGELAPRIGELMEAGAKAMKGVLEGAKGA